MKKKTSVNKVFIIYTKNIFIFDENRETQKPTKDDQIFYECFKL